MTRAYPSSVVSSDETRTLSRHEADDLYSAPSGYALVGWTRFFPAAVGQEHSADTLCVGVRSTSQTYQQVVVAPVYTGATGITIDRWSINVGVSAASAVYRIGAWTIDNQSNPFAWTAGTKHATLLRDVGAATGTLNCATTGAKTLADTLVIPANTWVLIGGVTQGATGANLVIGTNQNGVYSPYGLSVAGTGINTAGLIGLAQSTVTGALGDFTPSAGSAVGHGVAFRRSA